MDLVRNATKREWVRCPVCGEPDMRRESANADRDDMDLTPSSEDDS